MASDFFQPSNASETKTSTATPSAAAQAMAKFRADILGKLLEGAAHRGPTFKQFTGGANLKPPLPGGLNSGIGALLEAMSQPGAFTSSSTGEGELSPSAPSMFSDLAQLGLLGAVAFQSGLPQKIAQILSGVGGAKGIAGVNPALGDSVAETTGDPTLDALINTQYGGGSDMIPGGSASNVPSDYPGLQDDNSWILSLFS